MAQLLELPLPQVRGWTRAVDQLCDLADDFRTRGVRESRQLLEMFGEKVPRRRALARRPNQNGALGGGLERDCLSSDEKLRGARGSKAVDDGRG